MGGSMITVTDTDTDTDTDMVPMDLYCSILSLESKEKVSTHLYEI